jgi:hypothetical protein
MVVDLTPVIQQAWDTIPIDTITRLCLGFARHLNLCVEIEGCRSANFLVCVEQQRRESIGDPKTNSVVFGQWKKTSR